MGMSLDGKISTGVTDERDFDKDLPSIPGVHKGLPQYCELETQTDMFSLNTGRVMAKVGWNESKSHIEKLPVGFIILDNKPHLTARGVKNLLRRTNKLWIVTTNPQHPAYTLQDDRLVVLRDEQTVDFIKLFATLHEQGVDKLTVQSGGTLNATLLRQGLIDRVSIVVVPVLVGGAETPTLVDGSSLQTIEDLKQLRPLRLISNTTLEDSYIHLTYEVLEP